LSAELERLQKERARLEKLLAEKEVEQAILKELLALSNKKKRKRKKRNS
jgi:DNA gyrase/topoisomerase IV subunit A